MIELNIFDLNFNRLGEVSEHVELIIRPNYYNVGQMILRVAPTPELARLLVPGNILTTTTNVKQGFYIEHFQYSDKGSKEIEVIAYTLNYFLSWRSIPTQQLFNGPVESVIKSFIDVNAITTAPSRVIDNLRLTPNTGIPIQTESSQTGGEVVKHCFEICEANEMSFDVLMNHQDKKYDVYTWQGADRTTLQNVNSPVIFSKEFDNILNQNYVINTVDLKTTTYVAGEGEGVDRKVIVTDDQYTGFNRRELYVDARDIQSTYQTDGGTDVTLTPTEYDELLVKRGDEKKAEYQVIETFESDVDMNSQFRFNVDYFLGDKVSIRNDEIGKTLHTRVVSAELKSNRQGVELKVNFGSNIPTLYEKFEKKVNR